MENNYKEYLDSFAWKAIKQVKLQEQPNCECCGEPATTVHHLSYERRGSEKEDDIVSICERCHHKCHFVNGYQIKNDEETLRKRFEEVREEFGLDSKVNVEYFPEYETWNKLKIVYKGIYGDYGGYRTDGKKIFYLECFFGYGISEVNYNIDLKSLHFFNDHFFSGDIPGYNGMLFIRGDSASSVYIVGTDQDNFDYNLINLKTFKCSKKDPTIAIDKNYIYSSIYGAYRHNGLDINIDSFEYINNFNIYSRDKNYLYYDINNFGTNRKIIVDFDSFEIIDNIYSKDKSNIYYKGKIIKNVNINTFIKIDDIYSKDKTGVYYKGIIIEGANPETFVILNENYGKDKNYVYFNSEKVKHDGIFSITYADPKTFKITGSFYGEDKKYKYIGAKTK